MDSRRGNETHSIRDSLGKLGLYGLGSHERFIPAIYKEAAVEQRMELVRGLMDTDGYVCVDGSLSFTTTSPQLANDFQELIWSLGGIAKQTTKVGAYRVKGVKVRGRTAYTVRFRVRNGRDFVTLERKKVRLSDSNQYSDVLALGIKSIERDGDEETKCILVDTPQHLYLTDGYVVTHNTLTAETVAELLHRPLYTISVGELGTDPDQLEERLRVILDVATMWNAVLLLDEADIFLEARNEEDIVRNAMVGVFLRLLEYHQGVLFLTTNRVRNIDQAFFSRISVALKFDDAGPTKRAKIWQNLLDAARIENVDVARLSAFDINGRQIKNSIRLAQTLARSENVPVTADHIERTINLSLRFQNDMQIG